MTIRTVSAALTVRPVTLPQTPQPLAASLFYSSKDPYAVRVTFHAGLDEPVEWIFARDLLAGGTSSHAGLGSVRIWPSVVSQDGTPGRVLNIELTSSLGRGQFEMSATEVSDFLHRTYQIVPAGRESEHVDIAAELDDLLWGSK